MNVFKRIIWLFFYILSSIPHKMRLGLAATKRFFNRPVSQAKALGAGLAGGAAAGAKAIRQQVSQQKKS